MMDSSQVCRQCGSELHQFHDPACPLAATQYVRDYQVAKPRRSRFEAPLVVNETNERGFAYTVDRRSDGARVALIVDTGSPAVDLQTANAMAISTALTGVCKNLLKKLPEDSFFNNDCIEVRSHLKTLMESLSD
jgi:hypothetical protein